VVKVVQVKHTIFQVLQYHIPVAVEVQENQALQAAKVVAAAVVQVNQAAVQEQVLKQIQAEAAVEDPHKVLTLMMAVTVEKVSLLYHTK
jgi:Flp pilus assembly protein TadG